MGSQSRLQSPIRSVQFFGLKRGFQRNTLLSLLLSWTLCAASTAEDWTQLKFDSRQSGNVPDRTLQAPLGLCGAVAVGDSIFTSPVVGAGKVYVVDGSGTAWCFDVGTLNVVWKFSAPGGNANCNNLCSPALVDGKLHFGTMVGRYYVLDAATGKLLKEIACGDPVLGAPVVSAGRVYFTTLGSRVYALDPDGCVCWTWDFVREVMKFTGDRWSAADWLKHKQGRVNWQDQFCATIGLAADKKRIVLPAGGRLVWLDDAGDRPQVAMVGEVPAYSGKDIPRHSG